jgi:hypothetical protein
MATIKVYADIEQSKKLAGILPLESADGFWVYHEYWYSEGDEWEGYEDYPRAEPYLEYTRKENEWKEDKSDIPCWSLTALFKLLPKSAQLEKGNVTELYRVILPVELETSDWHIDPVDACVEMIEKLHELNLI